ncbi:glycerol acyltransferase, partial [Streptomyces sp. SID7958]|nr:glycerol acyltransferase [Streptomyces sp. SID7958]
MADAKVIPFDDDRSRGNSAQRASRRRGAGNRRPDPGSSAVGEVQPLPGRGP